MPDLNLPNHDAVNNGCGFSYPRSADKTFDQQSRAQLSPHEELTLFIKPFELYNIIQDRAINNPTFLPRCLRYKIDAKRKKRIQISVSISGSANTELPAHGIFPLHVLFARAISNDLPDGHSPLYRFSQAHLLSSFSESEDSDHTKATFTIPDLESLATSPVCNLNIILISYGQRGQHLSENFSENHMQYSSPLKLAGQCFWGKIPIDLLCSSLNPLTLSLGENMKLISEISMSPGFIKPTFLEHGSCLSFCSRKADATGSYELQAMLDAHEAGASAMNSSLYSSYSYDNVLPSFLPDFIRLRTGNVLFNYMHCSKFLKMEVTEDFSCSICLVKCGSFKGLECHLISSHELFHFEFVVTENFQAVNVHLKIDTRRAVLLSRAGEGDERNKKIFSYRVKKRCRRLATTSEKTKHVHTHIMEPGSPGKTAVDDDIVESRSPENKCGVHAHTMEPGSSKDAYKGSRVDYVPNENGISVPQASIDSHPALEIDSHPALHDSNHSTRGVLEFGKSRRLSVGRADPRNRLLLQKREFFHSQKAQRMELEEVLADHDSEDEIDDDIADFEDMTLLDAFSDVTKDEKRIMHMWNSFVRKQRVLADGHVPWACQAFSRQHGQELVHNPALRWCWRFLMIKLWNHSVLDARTMDSCNKFLDELQSKGSGPKQPDS